MHKTFALIRTRVSALMMSALCMGPAVQATEYTVAMTSDWEFSPNYLEIEVGDIVTWVNQDYTLSYHDSYCPGYWSTGYLDVDESASLMFLDTGTYNYRDSNFYILGMTGTIVVKPATPQQPVPATLIDPMVLPDGRFQCTVSNLVPGKTYIIEASTNLVNWTPISTNVAASTMESYVDDGAAAFRHRCYRSVHLP
jgi:plastocyanin